MDFRKLLQDLSNENIVEIKNIIENIEERRKFEKFQKTIKKIENIRKIKPFLKQEIDKVKLVDLTDFEELSKINSINSDLVGNFYNDNGVSGEEYNDKEQLVTLPSIVSRCTKIQLYKPLDEKTSLSDFNYIDTTNYIRGEQNTLLPLDFIQFHNDNIDIGIFCVEIYDKNFNLISSRPLNITYADGTIEVGTSLNDQNDDDDDDDDDQDENDIRFSTLKDTNGNVYVLKHEITLNEIKDYLNLNNTIEPSNCSKYSHYNSNNIYSAYVDKLFNKKKEKKKTYNLPTPNNNNTYSSFSCYIKGFFITNYYSVGSDGYSADPEKYHTNMIWLNQLTLVKFISSEDGSGINQIIIGDFMNYENKVLTLKSFTDNTKENACYSCLPILSKVMDYQDQDFTNINCSILSIENYFSN